MDAARYAELTRRLLAAATAEPRVLGLVALGSMADQGQSPDRFSDHDFFLVTETGAQQHFRRDLSWLPDAGAIALAFQETAHGLKVVYVDGHLLEFAVFDLAELDLARVNRYRVLLDRADLASRMAALASRTATERREQEVGERVLFGQLLCHLLVGAARAARGEELSGRASVGEARRELAILAARLLPTSAQALLDNLDPLRRFERAYPELGRELARFSVLPTVGEARGILDLAENALAAHLDFDPRPALAAVRTGLDALG